MKDFFLKIWDTFEELKSWVQILIFCAILISNTKMALTKKQKKTSSFTLRRELCQVLMGEKKGKKTYEEKVGRHQFTKI